MLAPLQDITSIMRIRYFPPSTPLQDIYQDMVDFISSCSKILANDGIDISDICTDDTRKYVEFIRTCVDHVTKRETVYATPEKLAFCTYMKGCVCKEGYILQHQDLFALAELYNKYRVARRQ